MKYIRQCGTEFQRGIAGGYIANERGDVQNVFSCAERSWKSRNAAVSRLVDGECMVMGMDSVRGSEEAPSDEPIA